MNPVRTRPGFLLPDHDHYKTKRSFTYCAFSTNILSAVRWTSMRKGRQYRTGCGFTHPMVPQQFATGMPPHGRSVPPTLDVAGSNPARRKASNSVGRVPIPKAWVRIPLRREADNSVVEYWTFNPAEGSRALLKKCPFLKAMSEPPVRSVALEQCIRPAFVLRSALCKAAALGTPPPERIGTVLFKLNRTAMVRNDERTTGVPMPCTVLPGARGWRFHIAFY